MRASSGSYPTPRMARSDSARASATLRWTRALRGAPRLCRGASGPPSGGMGGPSRPPILINGELDEVVIGIAEVHAGRHTARARPWSGPGLWHHAVTLQQSEDLVDGPVPFET